ncbi:M23 family metallopeptidase [Kitasatospora aureofaciens]|uniref:M23 family metallopeptidase n=1 Tax=Kitasatospora aureofaciens TaxID=1894 RepID=UPI00069138C8|nr:M23 family metallopeptidase [Kitasatospora aureofaciens]
MASTHTPAHPAGPAAGTQLLDHPGPNGSEARDSAARGSDHAGAAGTAGHGDPFAPEAESSRHRLPRQTRGASPLLGVTAVAATLGATGFAAATPAAAPAVEAPDETPVALAADPGLALAARIQQQADSQRTAAEESARLQAAQEAEAKAAAKEAEAKRAAEEAERAKAAALTLPVKNYNLSAHYGQSARYWAHLHTGLDFAADTGTAVYAVGQGTITSAGWSGSYGYRIVETLPDGTEIWYCHLSSIIKGSGEVTSGQQIGKVGATGNVTGPHLHLEVRPGGGAPVDPEPWLQQHGLNP